MRARGRLRELTINPRERTQNITVTVREDVSAECESLWEKEIDIEIRPHKKRRSLDANDLCWALCTEIGNAMRPPVPKEEVYRRAIRDVGSYFPVPIREDQVELFQARWQRNGIGWFAEVADRARGLAGYVKVFAYCGSSSYDTREMSRLLDYLMEDARAMEIAIPFSKKEEEELLKRWSLPKKSITKK